MSAKAAAIPSSSCLPRTRLARTATTPASSFAPASFIAAAGGVALASLGVLLWMIFAGPGYMGYGASLLWTGAKETAQPLYALSVAPGDVAVRRNSDQLITAVR